MSDTTKFEIVLVRSAPGASGSLAFRDKFIGRYCQGMATLLCGNPSATITICVCVPPSVTSNFSVVSLPIATKFGMRYLVPIFNVLRKFLDEILGVCRDERKCSLSRPPTSAVSEFLWPEKWLADVVAVISVVDASINECINDLIARMTTQWRLGGVGNYGVTLRDWPKVLGRR